jgi:malonate-semialdehyde dehydrogenase (acetylating)/methylmalonate-semialdehyde dehydrogenase
MLGDRNAITMIEPKQDYGKLQLSVGGSWIESESEEFHDVYNPATGAVIAKVPFSTKEEVGKAVQAAQAAYEKWHRVSIIERVKYLFKMKEALEAHFEELSVLNTLNHGKTLEESRGDMSRALENVNAAIGVAYVLSKGENLSQVASGVDIETSKEPLGPFAIISPFNFPVMIPFWFLPYAIVLGNTLVVKPSEITPVPMHVTAKIIQDEVKLPPGVMNLVHGAKDVVEGLISHPDIQGVTFVGSTPVAKLIYKLAGEHGKRAIVNGGAKNSLVVMPDANLASTLPNMIGSFFGNTGQRCLAGANLVAVGEVHDTLLRKFVDASSKLKVGYGLEEGIDMGPLVSESARRRTSSYVEIGTSEGSKLILDGRRTQVPKYPKGFYLGPTVLDGVDPKMRVSTEEIFGPLAGVVQTENLDSAIELVNTSTSFGNMASIYTTNGGSAREFRERVNAGNVGVNIGVAAPPGYFPFGGKRDSFYGVLHGQLDCVDFFTDKKVTITRW